MTSRGIYSGDYEEKQKDGEVPENMSFWAAPMYKNKRANLEKWRCM